MKRIKVAQIGTGHDHARDVISVLKQENAVFELVGFCIVPEDKENVSVFSYESNKTMYDGVPQMTLEEILNYEGIQAVFIETEDRALTKYALMAAEKGLHIHMDKPGGVDETEYDQLIDLVSSKKLVFQAGYMYRYNPAIEQLKKDIQSGKLGDVLSVEAQMNCSHEIEKRNWLGNYPGGMMYFLGCHMIDLVYSIMGEPLEIIPLSCSSGVGDTTAKDFGMVVYRYPQGISFAKSTAIEIGGGVRRQLVVVGTKGTAQIQPLEEGAEDESEKFPFVSGITEALISGEWEYYTTGIFGRYTKMLREFASYINGEKSNPFDYEYERSLHKLILKSCGK